VVAWWVEALCYNPEDRGFHPRFGHWVFQLTKSFHRTMVLGSILPLTEMSTRSFPGGKGRPARKTDNHTVIFEPTVWIMWEPRRLTIIWASTVCYRDSFTFFIYETGIRFLYCIKIRVCYQKTLEARALCYKVLPVIHVCKHRNCLPYTSSRRGRAREMQVLFWTHENDKKKRVYLILRKTNTT
jgi:hypothetical protein